MKEFHYQVTGRLGMHARFAGLFAQSAMEWKSTVTMFCKDKQANAKQVLDILNLGAGCGDEVCIRIEGIDEDDAAENLKTLLEKLFA